MKFYIYFIAVKTSSSTQSPVLLKQPSDCQKFTMITDTDDMSENMNIIKNYYALLGTNVLLFKIVGLTKKKYEDNFKFCLECLHVIFRKDKNLGIWLCKNYKEPQLDIVNYIKDINFKIFYITNDISKYQVKSKLIQSKLETLNFVRESEITFVNPNDKEITLEDIIKVLPQSITDMYSYVIDSESVTVSTLSSLLEYIGNKENNKIYYLDNVDSLHEIRKNNGITEIINGEAVI